MNNLEQQLKNIVMSNVPTNITMPIQVENGTEAKIIITMLNNIEQRIKSLQVSIYRIQKEAEDREAEQWYRGMFSGK